MNKLIIKRSFFAVVSLSITLFSELYAQTLTSNPYSYFGIGLIENPGFCENSALGSSGIAMPSISRLNSLNPASYVGLPNSTFLLYFGVFAKFSKYQSQGITQKDFDGNLKYLAMGLKLNNWWGTALGVEPFSSRGYYVTSDFPVEGDLNTYTLIMSGSGNISRFYFTNSFKLSKNFSFGFNTSYLFGSLTNTEEISYNSLDLYDIYVNRTNYFRNFFFDFGVQYKFKIGENNYFTGLTYSPSQSLNTRFEKYVVNDGDTLLDAEENTSDFEIPASIGIGLGTHLFKEQLHLSLDYKFTKWSLSKYSYNSAKLHDAWQINSGIEYGRQTLNSYNYWNNVNYRLGFRYQKTYLNIKNLNINETAITAGLGLPSKFDRIITNISYEYAIVGTTSKGLIKERYSRIILGFSLSDKWFQRYKFE
ncbi:MAG: hypothetical protein U0W24_13025 [Bacteroidales bacterium]